MDSRDEVVEPDDGSPWVVGRFIIGDLGWELASEICLTIWVLNCDETLYRGVQSLEMEFKVKFV